MSPTVMVSHSNTVSREYADLYRKIFCRDCNQSSTSSFHLVGMKCGQCGSYNTGLDGGPLLRRTRAEDGAFTFTPLTDQELSGLGTQEAERAESDSPFSQESDGDDGWETNEEENDDPPGDTGEMLEEDLD